MYRFDPVTGGVATIHSFTGPTGRNPHAALTQASDAAAVGNDVGAATGGTKPSVYDAKASDTKTSAASGDSSASKSAAGDEPADPRLAVVAVVRRSVLRRVQGPQRVHDHPVGLGDLHGAALAADPVDHAAGDAHRRLQVLR